MIYSGNKDLTLSPEHKVFALVWSQVVDAYLCEFNYMARLADSSFELWIELESIHYQWSGYNDSMAKYVEETLLRIQKMRSADVEKIFSQVRERLLYDWENFYLK